MSPRITGKRRPAPQAQKITQTAALQARVFGARQPCRARFTIFHPAGVLPAMEPNRARFTSPARYLRPLGIPPTRPALPHQPAPFRTHLQGVLPRLILERKMAQRLRQSLPLPRLRSPTHQITPRPRAICPGDRHRRVVYADGGIPRFGAYAAFTRRRAVPDSCVFHAEWRGRCD